MTTTTRCTDTARRNLYHGDRRLGESRLSFEMLFFDLILKALLAAMSNTEPRCVAEAGLGEGLGAKRHSSVFRSRSS
eukprot:IDg9672t1